MNHIATIAAMRSLAGSLRAAGKRIGFVPTMGFLHDGHLSLMRKAREENDAVVASIFVNPTQFGPHEDLDRYPRDVEGDAAKCASAGVDALFLPSAKEMYPEPPSVFVNVEGISSNLEGAVRPGHFRGVATVVAKLFHIVRPDRAYFGQKDYQQCAVIRRMTKGLDLDVEIAVLPTVREPDGLAMSSRNVYLSPEERQRARALSQALRAGEEMLRAGERDADAVRRKMREALLAGRVDAIDYAEVADADTLEPLDGARGRVVLLIAARLGKTRLIDNVVVVV